MKQLLFFEKTPFMANELLDLLGDKISLVSFFHDDSYEYLKKSGYSIHTYGNKQITQSIDSDIAVNQMLSDSKFIKGITKKGSRNYYALFFYMSQDMNLALEKTNMQLALPDFSIQERLGNKNFLPHICRITKTRANKSLIFDMSSDDSMYVLNKSVAAFGYPFIVQGANGVSGEDTYLINSDIEFYDYVGKLNKTVKISRFLSDVIPLSVHICITDEEILYDGPFLQIVGFKELAANPFQFSGNDTNQLLFSSSLKENAYSSGIKIAKYARKIGYRGIMGIDYLWDKKAGRLYVQEINSRLVGLTRLLTGIQMEQKISPHLVEHINTFNQIGFSQMNKSPISLIGGHYSQIYISHTEKMDGTVCSHFSPGIYKIARGKLIKKANSTFLSDIRRNEFLITYCAAENQQVHTDQVIMKVILKESMIDDNSYLLTSRARKVIKTLKTNIMQ